MNFRCPVCMYPNLSEPPCDYHICPCCGTEFENDDADVSHAELRSAWIRNGAPWFFGQPPRNWNPAQQLYDAGFGFQAMPIESEIQCEVISAGIWRLILPKSSESIQFVEAA